MKKVLLLALLIIIGVGGYWYYRTVVTASPQYSLAQAANAVRTHDVTTFERYVDVNRVARNLVDQVSDESSALEGLNVNGAIIQSALRLLKPQLAQSATQEVRLYIESGSAEAAAAGQNIGGMNVSVLGLAGRVIGPNPQFKGIKYVNQKDDQTLVGLEITQPQYDTTLVLELKMLDQGDYWRVTEIANMGTLIKHTARLEKQRLLKNR
ncbi:hypothetical protein GCM10011375_10410 [Hymenobacter qilianensis]|uniref:Uncharacterized protein n=2 Tax=Hymenobacter qilianensis TaxID=1385715 RepID=A0ACB5PNV3_9BACT|nr:DUF2939 domain-containing protein [Hymenobacter qilianensis]QNP53366.1 DUF2939 domain-containing protein [Hymenobacter qilianensis]GGF57163.1 hypothetical protein GCM10011375_10410 [Hymenobacter qilianensis]